jgi:hypothetical protein
MSYVSEPRLNVRSARSSLSGRVREVREELFGMHGGPELARRLGLAARTWANYEGGVMVPGEVVLAFLEVTKCDAHWLATGEGPMFPGEWSLGADDGRGLGRIETLAFSSSRPDLSPAAEAPAASVEKTLELESDIVRLQAAVDRAQQRAWAETEHARLALENENRSLRETCAALKRMFELLEAADAADGGEPTA